jgi:hypothetical protein
MLEQIHWQQLLTMQIFLLFLAVAVAVTVAMALHHLPHNQVAQVA